MEITKDQALSLAGGEAVTLPSGHVLRLVQEPDDNTTLNDFDCYGKTEWTKDSWRGPVRPDSFDGSAEKLGSNHGQTHWWQPPTDTKEDRRQWHTDADYRRGLRNTVREIVDYGFTCYKLELCEGADAYGQLVVRDFTVLGGVEPFSGTEDVSSLVLDMAHDIEIGVPA